MTTKRYSDTGFMKTGNPPKRPNPNKALPGETMVEFNKKGTKIKKITPPKPVPRQKINERRYYA